MAMGKIKERLSIGKAPPPPRPPTVTYEPGDGEPAPYLKVVKEAPPKAEEAPPAPLEPPAEGLPLSVRETSGDKFIVRTQMVGRPVGEYRQEVLSKSEIEERGGFVPPSGVSVDEVREFAQKHGMSEKAAADTLTKFQRDPTDPEFAALATADKESLLKTAPPKVAVQLVEIAKDKPKLFVETVALRKLATIKDPEERFYAMQSLRLIPKGREWIDPAMLSKAREALEPYKQPEGTYDVAGAIDKKVTPAYLEIMFGKKAVEEVKASLVGLFHLPDGSWVDRAKWNKLAGKYQTIAMREGLLAMERVQDVDIKEWDKRHIELADGNWMLISDWNAIKTDYPDKWEDFQKIGLGVGFDAMDKAIETHHRIEKRKYDAAIKAMEEYRVEYRPPGVGRRQRQWAYDLYAARQAGVPKTHIITLFGEVKLKETEKLLRERAEVIPSYDAIAIGELEKAVREHGDMWRYKGQLITDGEREDTIKAYEGLPYKTRMMVVHPADEMTKEQPALVLAADPKWQELKDKPKSDPARQAYLAEWQKKLLDTVALAGMFVAPYTWGLVGRIGYALTPTRIAATPIINIIPRIATALAQITFTGAPIAYTGATINESLLESNLQRKWEIFSNADSKLQDGYAKMAGFDKPFNKLTDAEKASVLLHYTVPRDYSLSQWSRVLAEHTEKMIENVGKGSAWIQEKYPHPGVTIPLSFAGGAVAGILEGISYTAQLPMIAANLVAKVPEGDPKAFATEVGAGFVAFFTTVLPMAIRADPALATGRITGLFLLAPASVLKLAQGAKAKLSPRYIAERAMGQEITTMRVELVAGNLAKLTKAQRIKVGEQLTMQLLAGEKTARLKIGNTTWVAEVRNVPMQIVKKNIGYHFTPDITTFDPAKGTGKLYLSPQAARQAGLASLVKGEKMKHPGLIEVHLPEKFSPKIDKLLSRKQVELEIPLKDRIYDPIPGSYGKGVSSNVQMGAYPIRRYVIRGAGVEVAPLSVKQLAEVKVLTLKEATLDAISGWHGRQVALKAKLAKDPRIKKVNESIKTLESEVPEIVDAKGNIIRQRVPIPHPIKPGLMRNRVTAVMVDKLGRVLLVKTANDPQFYSLPGGRAIKGGMLPERGARTGQKITFAESAAGQTLNETGINWTGSSKYRGIYLGKINEYSLSGSRIYELRAKNTNINVRRYGDTELSHAFWWDGKTKVTVSPAVYQILKSYPHLDLSLVSVYKGSPLLNKAIDRGYVGRVKKGKFISEKDIALINKVELQRLKVARQKLIKGEPLGFGEWLTAENDFATLAELIHGRRRATRVIHDGVVSKSELQTLFLHPELITKKAWTILKKTLEKKKLSPEEVKLLEKELTKAFEVEKAKLQEAFDKAYEASYRENRSYFDRRYAGLYERMVAKVAGIRRVAPERREEIIDRYIAELRAFRPERVYRPEARRLPVTYGKPYIGIRELTRYDPTIYKPLEYRPIEYKKVTYKPYEPYKPPKKPPYKPTEPPYKPPEKPPYKPPEKPPYKPPDKPPFVPPRGVRGVRQPQRVPGGSIAWASGRRKGVRGRLVPNWFFIPPPFDQEKPISLSAPPLGARHTDSVKPYETIQVIGRSRRGVPKRVEIDLGWADIEVINGKEIRFKGGGLETDVGTRMPSPTKGMDLGEGGFVGEPVLTRGVSRPRMAKKKPRRKKRLTREEYMTTLKGFRP